MVQRVRHSRWGEGFVESERYSGLELYVRFTSGIKLWVKRSELIFQDQPQLTVPVPVARVSITQHPPSPNYKERCIIECLRLGIVPLHYVHEFTFGRQREIEMVKKWLDLDEGVLFVIGPYGSGKSHLLNYLMGLALSSKFAVCTAELDPNESPMHKPKKVYSHLLRSLRLRLDNRLLDFRQLLSEISRRDPLFFRDNPYLYRVLSYVGRGSSLSDYALDWIEGNTPAGLFRPPLYDHATAANLLCNILSSLAYALKNLMHLRGLVIILDEAENITSPWLYTYQKEKASNFLQGLISVANNDRSLLDEQVISSDVYRGERTKLIYHAHANHIRYAYRLPSCTKLVVGFTIAPQADVDTQKEWRLYLEPLSDEGKRDIIQEICRLYQVAYAWKAPERIEQEIFSMLKGTDLVRRYIKSVVEILDYARLVKRLGATRQIG